MWVLSPFVGVLTFFRVVVLNNLGGVLAILVGYYGSCDHVVGEENVVAFIPLYGEVGACLRGLGIMFESYPFDS